MSKELERGRALRLMVTTDKTQAEIARIVGVSQHTLSEWSQAGDWPSLRRSAKVTEVEIKTCMMAELDDIRGLIQARPIGERFATRDESSRRNDILQGLSRLKTVFTQEQLQDLVLQMEEFFLRSKDANLVGLVVQLFTEFFENRTDKLFQPETLSQRLPSLIKPAAAAPAPVTAPAAIEAAQAVEVSRPGDFIPSIPYTQFHILSGGVNLRTSSPDIPEQRGEDGRLVGVLIDWRLRTHF